MSKTKRLHLKEKRLDGIATKIYEPQRGFSRTRRHQFSLLESLRITKVNSFVETPFFFFTEFSVFKVDKQDRYQTDHISLNFPNKNFLETQIFSRINFYLQVLYMYIHIKKSLRKYVKEKKLEQKKGTLFHHKKGHFIK